MQLNDDLESIDRALKEGGISAALRVLNTRTPHRFTGIFKFNAAKLENLYLFDREDSAARPWETFPATNSFCSIIRDTGEAFTLSNSATDARVAEHPARDRISSYCGVPLFYPDGQLFGSLCHFDYQPIVFSDLDLDALRSAAPLLMQSLLQ